MRTWAFVRGVTRAHEAPSSHAHVVARLGELTQFGTRELALVIGSSTGAEGDEWLRVRLPVRPNGSTGWVLRSALGELRTARRSLVIDTEGLGARLLEDGAELWAGPVGVGAARWPTPRGDFYVRTRVVPSPRTPLYGSFVFCTNGFATESPWPGGELLAIHGTNRPELLPGRVSAGCIRVRDDDVVRLRELVPLGTPVSIV